MKLSKQEIFDISYKGLASQGFEQSLRCNIYGTNDNEPNYAYRGDGGRKCAIGWLIPDEEYDPRIEGLDVYAALLENMDLEVHAALLENMDLDGSLLAGLLMCHDRGVSPAALQNELQKFADFYHLIIAELP